MTHSPSPACPNEACSPCGVRILTALVVLAAGGAALGVAASGSFSRVLFLIPLLPGLAAALNGLLLNKLPKPLVNALALGSVGAAFLFALGAFVELKLTGTALTQTLYTWIDAPGGLTIPIAYRLDALSGIMTLVVSGVGFLIHVYSLGYMAHDASYARYFTYLNLFTFAMLTLVLGDNLPLLFVGWEGVGLCSYLLIGFWFTDMAKAKAGKKAFLLNRIGDVGFMLGMLLLAFFTGALDFTSLAAKVGDIPGVWLTIIALLFFLGATGKSAQLPLYVWLPDAMAGPTPVSALIHAATMVTAGVYLIARLNFLYVLAPTAMAVVAVVGGLTALFAASIGLFQTDIKKVLAYSTVSQLGFMFMGVGVGAFVAAIFHLMTHAFFKACLFLGSGSVIHGMHEEQDIRKMGGLKAFMPVTAMTFFISCLAIAGIPLLSGFFSKDEILYHVMSLHYGLPAWAGLLLWSVGALAAFGTAFYMFRLYYLTFTGECRASEEVKAKGIHESPRTMTIPLIVLAGLAIIGGYVGLPEHLLHVPNLFAAHLEPIFAASLEKMGEGEGGAGLEALLMGVSSLIAVAGWLTARTLYKDGRSEVPARLAAKGYALYRLILHKYYVDELYGWAIVRPFLAVAQALWRAVDVYVFDGVLVKFSSFVVRSAGRGLRYMQTGNAQTYLLVFLIGVAGLMFYFWQGIGL